MWTIITDKNIPRSILTKILAPVWPTFVWTPLSASHVARMPDPILPGPLWLRVRNEACGICATDLALLFVHADPRIAPAALPGLTRFFLGHEPSSIVTELGPGVTRFRPGERSEEHTSELQSPDHLVSRLLLEKQNSSLIP